MRSDTLFFSLLVGMTTLPVQRIPRVCASAPACVGPVSLAHASIRTLSLSLAAAPRRCSCSACSSLPLLCCCTSGASSAGVRATWDVLCLDYPQPVSGRAPLVCASSLCTHLCKLLTLFPERNTPHARLSTPRDSGPRLPLRLTTHVSHEHLLMLQAFKFYYNIT